jgi:ABC-type transport system substrate-binding protein
MRPPEAALVLAAASLLVLGDGGCQGDLSPPIPAAHEESDAPRHGGVLHLASFGDVRTLDPAVGFDGLTSNVTRFLFAGLVDYDADGGVVPDLAARMEEKDDGRTYRFTLRENVRFHDGSEFTAADVKRTFERALHPTTPCPTAGFYQAIDGFEAYTTGQAPHLEGVVVEGRYAVAVHLREPDATFLRALALTPLRITCPSAGDRYSPSWTPCGAGPYRLLEGGWQRGQSITIVRHEGYFRPERPYLDAISVELNASMVSQGFHFARGELDAVADLTQAETMRYQRDARWRPLGQYDLPRSVVGVGMNTERPPFDNVEVRRAVAAAIDREHGALIKSSNLIPYGRPVPPGIPGYDAAVTPQHYDLAAALEHMRKAGYAFDPATGRGGLPGEVRYDVYRASLFELSGQLLQEDLARIGIHLELRISSYPTHYTLAHRRGASQMSAQSWLEDFPDPSDFLEPLFARKSISDEDSMNAAFYSNAALDEILVAARRERDPRERERLYARAEQRVCDDAPWAFEYVHRLYHVHQPYVRGYRLHPAWSEDVSDVWLDRGGDVGARADAPFAKMLLGSLDLKN